MEFQNFEANTTLGGKASFFELCQRKSNNIFSHFDAKQKAWKPCYNQGFQAFGTGRSGRIRTLKGGFGDRSDTLSPHS